MKGIPPEIDNLMWQLAEDGGPVAQAEFEARHARYGPELSRRIRMVAELRQAGKTVCHRPTFTPRPARVAPTSRWAVGSAVGLAVLAVGAVAYVAAGGGEKIKPAPLPLVPHIQTAPAKEPMPEIVQGPKLSPPPAVADSAPDPKPEPVPNYNQLHDVRIADTSLTAAIGLVAAGANLKVTIAPGFEDQKVSLDYRSLSAIDTLKAMGEKYGFTVFEEEDGHVIVVPVRSSTTDRRIGA